MSNSTTVIHVTPDPDCPLCHGEGEVYDIVPYGSTTALLPNYCNCVEVQLPDDYDIEIVIEKYNLKPPKDGE